MTDDALEQAFARLRLEYLEEMPQRLDVLSEAARTGDFAAARMTLHQLAGSGGSHGFPAISDAARDVELWLVAHPDAPDDDRRARIAQGLAALRDAVAASSVVIPRRHA